MSDTQELMQYKIHRAVQWELAKGHMRAALATFVSGTEYATREEASERFKNYIDAKGCVENFIRHIEDEGIME